VRSEFELLLKGVHLVDPVSRIDGIRDIGIAEGRIAAVEEAIAPASARKVEALTGKIAVPGIIDTHVHASPLAGGNSAHRMLARAGVTTALEMSGPVEAVWKLMAAHGAGLNLACVHAVAPGLTVENRHPSRRVLEKLLSQVVSAGALGLKILGGHLPLTPAATERCIDLAHRRGRYCAFHAGTTRAGSNLNGLLEAIALAGENRLHLAHINSYCRGQVKTAIEETMEAIEALEKHPNILSESNFSPTSQWFSVASSTSTRTSCMVKPISPV
jgi:dihydroorotase-like cyclic amidohydrolase